MLWLNSLTRLVFGSNVDEVSKNLYAKEIASVFSMQMFALAASLAISLIISNYLGAAAYGTYSYAFSWVNLLAVFSCMGMEQLAMKEVPAYRGMNKLEAVKGLFRFSASRVFIISLVTSVALFLFSWLFHQPKDETLRYALWLAIPVLPVIAQANLRSCWLRAYHFNTLSQLPDKLLRPALVIVGIGILYFFFPGHFNVINIILLSEVLLVLTLVVDYFIIRQNISFSFREIKPVSQSSHWIQVSWSLFLVTFFYFFMSQLNLLMLGSLLGPHEAGVYGIASRISDLEGYILAALNVVLAPLISKFYSEGKIEKLQNLITRSLRGVFVLSSPLLLVFILFPGFFLRLFGNEFSEGKFTLIILSIAQIFNLATGSVGYLLTMTGNHKSAVRLLSIFSLIAVALSFLLIKTLGLNGAAISTALIGISLNAAMAVEVFRRTGINSTILSNRKPVKPNFFIVGAPKSGTTSMYQYLKSHPDVYLPRKELLYFCTDLHFRFPILNDKEFMSYYRAAKNEKAVGEVSVWNLYSRDAARRIKEFNPEAKIIIMLRNPVDMIYSLHGNYVFNGNETISDFKKAVLSQHLRREGKNISPHIHGPLEGLYYYDIGNYAPQVKRYFDYFGKENVMIIFFEDFISKTSDVYRRVLKLIGADSSFQPEFKVYNQSKAIRSNFLKRLTITPPSWLKWMGRLMFPHQTPLRDWLMNFLWQINTKPVKVSPMDQAFRTELQSHFRRDIEELEQLTVTQLESWKEKNL